MEESELKVFEVWSEGYAATGEHGTAMYHGKVLAKTFNEACILLVGKSLDKDEKAPDGYRINVEGNYSIWACGLYPTEAEARKAFG